MGTGQMFMTVSGKTHVSICRCGTHIGRVSEGRMSLGSCQGVSMASGTVNV